MFGWPRTRNINHKGLIKAFTGILFRILRGLDFWPFPSVRLSSLNSFVFLSFNFENCLEFLEWLAFKGEKAKEKRKKIELGILYF